MVPLVAAAARAVVRSVVVRFGVPRACPAAVVAAVGTPGAAVCASAAFVSTSTSKARTKRRHPSVVPPTDLLDLRRQRAAAAASPSSSPSSSSSSSSSSTSSTSSSSSEKPKSNPFASAAARAARLAEKRSHAAARGVVADPLDDVMRADDPRLLRRQRVHAMRREQLGRMFGGLDDEQYQPVVEVDADDDTAWEEAVEDEWEESAAGRWRTRDFLDPVIRTVDVPLELRALMRAELKTWRREHSLSAEEARYQMGEFLRSHPWPALPKDYAAFGFPPVPKPLAPRAQPLPSADERLEKKGVEARAKQAVRDAEHGTARGFPSGAGEDVGANPAPAPPPPSLPVERRPPPPPPRPLATATTVSGTPYQTDLHAAAYVARRMSPAYGACLSVLGEAARLAGSSFAPRTLLDFGSGPGTAVWAVAAASTDWAKSLRRVMCVEPSQPLQDMSERLLRPLNLAVERRRFFIGAAPQFDLVVANFVLGDLCVAAEPVDLAARLFASANPGGLVVLVEPGTEAGFDLIARARAFLMHTAHAEVLAPCPHEFACPLFQSAAHHVKHCSFRQRSRIAVATPGQRRGSNVETVFFSYLVLRKPAESSSGEGRVDDDLDGAGARGGGAGEEGDDESARPRRGARIIRAPLKRTKHVIIDACCPDGGFARRIVSRSEGKSLCAAARKARWGDMFHFPEPSEAKVQDGKGWRARMEKKAARKKEEKEQGR